MFIKLIITIGLVILNRPEIESANIEWIQSFVKSVQKDRQIHQVIFFTNEKKATSNQIFDNLLKKLSKKTSLLEMFTPNSEKPKDTDFTMYNPRVSLFILTNSKNDLEITRSFDFLTKLSEAKRRPKCLLLTLHNLPNYPQFFENLWNYQFLDVTIIKIGKSIEKTDLNSHSMDHYPDCKVFIYNPFSKLLTTEKPSDKTVWFPDKLKNMQGYPLEVILLHAPPDVFEPLNKSEKIYGLAIMKVDAWMKVLNFTMVRSSLSDWGKFGCSIEDSTGVCLTMYTNKAQILGAEAPVALCDGKPTELGKSVQSSKIGMVVPLVRKHIQQDILQWQIMNIFIVMILPFFFWIISRILMFNSEKWRMEYMVRIILGTSTPTEPEILAERIIFAAFLIGCFMFSSEIYTAINEVQLISNAPFMFETLEDVVNSDIQVMIDENYFIMLNTTDDVVLQQVLKKATYMTFSQDECVELLLEHKNLTCILEIPRAEWQLRSRRDECGRPLVKFIMDKFSFDAGATQLGAGVPYAKRFDQVIQRVIDSGIREKWMEPYTAVKVSLNQVGDSCNEEEMESVMKTRQLLFILITGFVCSFVAFIFELIIHRAVQINRRVFKKIDHI